MLRHPNCKKRKWLWASIEANKGETYMLTDRTVKAKCCNYRRQWFISWKGNVTCYFITNKPENAFFRFANEPYFYLLSYKSVMGMYSNNYYLILLPEKLLILILKKMHGGQSRPSKATGCIFFKLLIVFSKILQLLLLIEISTMAIYTTTFFTIYYKYSNFLQ